MTATNALNRTKLFFALALLAITQAPNALESDRQQPIEVNADKLNGQLDQSKATLTGNVAIKQGTLAAKADQAVVHRQADGNVSRAILTGNPAELHQALDGGGQLHAYAKLIDYDLQSQKVVLKQGVRLQQPQGNIEGEEITYDLKSGNLLGSGAGEKGQVRLHLNPAPADAKKDEDKKN